VTRLLPDDVWLHQFEVIEREVRIAGYAPNAATLVGALESSPLFQNVRFRAPITKATPGGLDRFELSADLRRDSAS
jgi:general secretion pathway protein L